MGDESKHNAGISDTNQKKDTVISELDSLRYTLNSGPEFQQDIPTLDDPYPVQSEQCDLFRGSDGLIHDPDLDIPILTDTLAPPDITTASAEMDTNSPSIDSRQEESTAQHSNQSNNSDNNLDNSALEDNNATGKDLEAPTEHQAPPPESSDTEQLRVETDSSVQELEQLLDELVAEQLPKLEQQLRDKLRQELKSK
jgi:hypothetical protein